MPPVKNAGFWKSCNVLRGKINHRDVSIVPGLLGR